MSYKFISRLALPVIALALFGSLTNRAQARFVNLSDLPKDSKLQDAVKKLEKDVKDKDAVAALKKAADAGDKEGQFAYAFALQNGLGGLESKDDKAKAKEYLTQAKGLYEKASKAGHAGAANNLLLLNLVTAETPEAVKDAVKAIEDAATAGNGKAKLTYAEMFLEGVGVAKDPEMAVRWLQRAQDTEANEAAYLLGLVAEGNKDEESCVKNLAFAADHGHVPSMIYLGTKILNGRGVRGSADSARGLFQKAVDAGVTAAKVNLGIISEVEASAEKDEAKQKDHYKKAMALYQEAAADKVPDAFLKIGYFYENGLGVAADAVKALEQYQKGADAGLNTCDYNLAVFNETGKGVKAKDEAKARELFYKAAKSGLPAAQLALGDRYRGGKNGFDKDPIAALAWFEKAAKAGDVSAQLQMANILETGEAGQANIKAAAELYLDAAKKGAPIAMYQIASMIEDGRAGKPDLAQAYAFLTACTKTVPADSELGKTANERLGKLKGKMSSDEIKAGDEAFQKLTGQPNKPTESPKDAPKDTPKEAPKTAPKPKTK